MIFKNLIIGLFLISFLTGCVRSLALLGPAYTLVNSGNIHQAGFTYGSNEIINKSTGKTVAQNFKEVLTRNKEEQTGFQK